VPVALGFVLTVVIKKKDFLRFSSFLLRALACFHILRFSFFDRLFIILQSSFEKSQGYLYLAKEGVYGAVKTAERSALHIHKWKRHPKLS